MPQSSNDLYQLRGGESWRDPWASYKDLRDTDPVHAVDHPSHGEFWVLSRFDDVFRAARDPATFSSAKGLTPDRDSMAMFEGQACPIVMMDPPDHTSMRKLVSRPMTPRRIAPMEDQVVAFVDGKLGSITPGEEVDIIDLLFKPLPSFLVARYLGVPLTDRASFDEWSSAIVAANASSDFSNAIDAASALFAYAMELIDRRRFDPGDDLVSGLVAAGEDHASAAWIVGFVFTMVTGGNDTTTGLLGGALELLTINRPQRQLLIDDPSLIRPAIDEFLRLTSPVQNLARTTTTSVDIRGQGIPADTKVMLLYGSANRDEREFGPEADQLDVHRKINRSLSFGSGAHHCLGAAVARLAAGVALERLLARFPDFTVDPQRALFAPGAFVRRHQSLPFRPGPPAARFSAR